MHQVARLGDDVFVSAMETGIDAPLLCNARWRLLKQEGSNGGNHWMSLS